MMVCNTRYVQRDFNVSRVMLWSHGRDCAVYGTGFTWAASLRDGDSEPVTEPSLMFLSAGTEHGLLLGLRFAFTVLSSPTPGYATRIERSPVVELFQLQAFLGLPIRIA